MTPGTLHITLKRIDLLLAILMLAGFAVSAQEEDAGDFDAGFERTAKIVVMIKADYDGVDEFGAGIIFGRQKDRLLIATAWHVIHRGTMVPQKILVTFRSMPGKDFEARVLKNGGDNGLDLAVIAVDNLAGSGFKVCDVEFDCLRRKDEIKRRDSVYPVGNPSGVAWALTPDPDKISQLSKNDIVFQSSAISSGHSGGALLNKDAYLLGMITADQPPFGKALHIDSLTKHLKLWGFPVLLMPSLNSVLTPLHWYANIGDVEAIKNDLEVCGGGVAARDKRKSIPLHYAAHLGSIQAITILLKAGSDINAVDADGDTPLHWAMQAKKWEAAKYLTTAGAKLTIKNRDGRTPIHWAFKPDILKFFIDAGIDVNTQDSYGYTLLQAAAKSGDIDRINMLLKAGADVNLANEYGHTPLINAVENKDEQAMKIFLKAGAKVNVHGTFGNTPLMIATNRIWRTGVITLIKAGADIEALDEGGYTALGRASRNRNEEMVKLLISLGAKE